MVPCLICFTHEGVSNPCTKGRKHPPHNMKWTKGKTRAEIQTQPWIAQRIFDVLLPHVKQSNRTPVFVVFAGHLSLLSTSFPLWHTLRRAFVSIKCEPTCSRSRGGSNPKGPLWANNTGRANSLLLPNVLNPISVSRSQTLHSTENVYGTPDPAKANGRQSPCWCNTQGDCKNTTWANETGEPHKQPFQERKKEANQIPSLRTKVPAA